MAILKPFLFSSFLLLAAPAEENAFSGPGWYDIQLGKDVKMTVQILEEKKATYLCQYQGTTMEIPKSEVDSLVPAKDVDSGNLANGKIREAIEELASRDFEVRRKAYDVLRKSFPGCRELVHKSLNHQQKNVRKLLAKLLGEVGEPSQDVPALVRLLRDPNEQTRLAVVMALRKIGPGDLNFDEFADYILWEPKENTRKMAVKAMGRWHDLDALDPLLVLLVKEKERGVRVFIGRALKDLTGKKFGEDLAAWKSYVAAMRQKELEDARNK